MHVSIMLYQFKHYRIYIGTARDGIYPHHYQQPIIDPPLFAPIQQQLACKELIFLKQIHSAHGIVIEKDTSIISFTHEGDYLITAQPDIAIGIMTADCLPVIIIDTKQNVIAIAHAGWRGIIANIAPVAIQKMMQLYNSQLSHIQIYFGPSAHNCCYTVSPSLVNEHTLIKSASIHRNELYYFSLVDAQTITLNAIGISDNQIDRSLHACTLCNEQFFSYRRQKETAGRQMTIIMRTEF